MESTGISDLPKIKFKKIYEDSIIPTYATRGAACFDISSYDNRTIDPGRTELIGTGLAVEIPEGYMLELRPRSGFSLEGIMIANSPGTIDSDFRGEIKIIIHNSKRVPCEILKGSRVAQCRITKLTEAEIVEVEKLTETDRGERGFGSTGR